MAPAAGRGQEALANCRAAVPKDLEESAQLDGASRLRIFAGIVLPVAKPVLIIIMIAPVVALIIALQKYIAKGLLLGAVKG